MTAPELRALKAKVKKLTAELATAKTDLRFAKKSLKYRNEQVTFHADHARKNAEDAQAMREVMATMCRTVLRVRNCMPVGLVDDTGWPELVALAKEWAP